MSNRSTRAYALAAVSLVLLAPACGAEADDAPSPSLLARAPIDGDETTTSTGPRPASEPLPEPAPVAPSPYQECPEGKWCSTLYPPTWTADATPDAEGRYLHDFSYAGYRNGEKHPVAPPGATYDVVASYGADATGAADATAAIQSAINAASGAGGGIVFFPAGTYRIDGVLSVKASRVILRGTGKTSLLHFANTRGMGNRAHVTFAGAVTREAPRAFVADAPARANEVLVSDANGLAPGDDVSVGWTITPAFVEEHGMTGTWTAFNGKHVPFFRSRVVSVDVSSSPHRVVLDVPLRYAAKVRDGAAIQRESGYLHEVGIEHLGLTNATTWSNAWAEHHAGILTMDQVSDAWIDDVHSMPTPGQPAGDAFHLRSSGILIEDSKRVSVLSSSMENPQNRGSGGNGYLFEIARTNEVLFQDCEARYGRHNFIQNWGFGNSGTVFLRCTSVGSELLSLIGGKLTPEPAMSEHHHSLAMATLVDSCILDDGFGSENRGSYSTGAGHTATEGVVWRSGGKGKVKSQQYGWGYVIGTAPTLTIDTNVSVPTGAGTAPEDFVEGGGQADTLYPASLYEDQRARRLGK